MEFIKILFNNIAFTVLSLLLLLLLLQQQIPAALSTTTENKYQNLETSTTTTTSRTTATTQQQQEISQSATTNIPLTYNNKNKNHTTTTTSSTSTSRELRKHEQIIDNSIDFTVDPCDDFYQYACGEWKPQMFIKHKANDDHTKTESKDLKNDNQNKENHLNDHLDAYRNDHLDDVLNNDHIFKYDRTLAMIDYLADKEVLKYFNTRNLTKNFNNTTTTTRRSQTTATTTKEPDFIIKVYKYYKSCIAIQQYEPIKYLEWLELNEHVKWPSLINTITTNTPETTTTATTPTKATTNPNEHDHKQQHHQAYTKSTTTESFLEEDEILRDEAEENESLQEQDLLEDRWDLNEDLEDLTEDQEEQNFSKQKKNESQDLKEDQEEQNFSKSKKTESHDLKEDQKKQNFNNHKKNESQALNEDQEEQNFNNHKKNESQNHTEDHQEQNFNNDSQESSFSQAKETSWFKTLAILRKYGLNGIFLEEIIYNTKSFPSKMLLGFNKPTRQGGFKSLKNDQLKIIIKNLNLPLTPESFKELWLKFTKFEWQLTKLNEITDDLGTTLISLEQLPVPWLYDYIQIMFKQKSSLDLNMRIVITNVAYFMALDDLLKEYDDTFLQQYLQIRFLWHLYQQEPQEFQPMECILHIKHFMPLALEWIYEQKNDDIKKEIPKILDLYNNLRRQFNLTLYNNKNNFDSQTLEKFVSKLESIQLKVGTFLDLDKQEFFYENRKFYQALKISSREFYFNHLKMLKFNFEALHFQLRTVTTHSLYYDMQEYYEGLSIAPYYNQRLNSLHLPLSLLQAPLYHTDYPDVYKFSTLGFLLAQTLMYGFNLNSLNPEDYQKLLQQVKCLRFMDPLELNDKISDVSGLRLAYQSFFHQSSSSPPVNLIANRKIFFLNFAQTFCALKASTSDDINRSHLNYALAQFPEFARIFECSPDSHMNPHEKCYLWD